MVKEIDLQYKLGSTLKRLKNMTPFIRWLSTVALASMVEEAQKGE